MRFQEFMEKSLLMGLYQKYHTHFSSLIRELRKQGLNLNQSLILLALFFENNGDVHPSDLEKVLLTPKDQISHELKKLEQMNFLKRQISPSDGRQRTLHLTSKGKQIASHLVGIFDRNENALENS